MRRLRLGTLLLILNVALLLLTVAGVATVAVTLLRQLADQQALARVQQAERTALYEIGRAGDDTLAAAQALAIRPELDPLIQAGDTAALTADLERYRRASHLDACVVLLDDRVVASTGATIPNAALVAARESGAALALVPQMGASLAYGATRALPAIPHAAVVAVRLLDPAFAGHLRDVIGLPVTIVDRDTAFAHAPEQQSALRAQALARGQNVSARLDNPSLYATIAPIRAPSGEIAGLLEVDLPSANITAPVGRLAGTLLVLALAVAGLAALASIYVGWRLSDPLIALTSAAGRMGAGDLTTPIRPARGAEIGLLASGLEDMRKHLLRATSDLRKQRAQAETIVTGIVEGVFAVDRERRINFLNPQAARLLGIDADAAIGTFCGDILRPRGSDGTRPCEHDCPIVHARFQGAVRATEHLVLADGSLRTVVVTSAAPTEGQQVQVLRDETEVETTRRMRDTVLANISHEFKTPLAAQHASIELLLDRLPDLSRDEIAQLVRALRRGTTRLTQLIDNLLESVRIESGHDRVRRQPVRLDDVVEAALEFTRPLMDLREQTIVLDLPHPLPEVLGDAPRLTQVFVNLLANANKFAPTQSTITLGGAVAEHSVTLWVRDSGPGLPPAASRDIFARFARVASGNPEQGGMGLGLWIARSIVERHGGRIEGETLLGEDGTSAGARLCVTLPLEWENDEAAAG